MCTRRRLNEFQTRVLDYRKILVEPLLPEIGELAVVIDLLGQSIDVLRLHDVLLAQERSLVLDNDAGRFRQAEDSPVQDEFLAGLQSDYERHINPGDNALPLLLITVRLGYPASGPTSINRPVSARRQAPPDKNKGALRSPCRSIALEPRLSGTG